MVAYAYAALYPDKVERLVVMDAPLPGIAPWDDIVKDHRLWHFSFWGPDEERLVQGRERIYLDRIWNDFSATPTQPDDATRKFYAAQYAKPGAMRAGFAPTLGGTVAVLNPVARYLFAHPEIYPLPNVTTSSLTNNYVGTIASATNNNQGDIKIDAKLTAKDNLSGRFTIGRENDGPSRVSIPTQLGQANISPYTGSSTDAPPTRGASAPAVAIATGVTTESSASSSKVSSGGVR